MTSQVSKSINHDIGVAKRKLIAKYREDGIYENFGQREVRKLHDKYSDFLYSSEFNPIDSFDQWCMNFTGAGI